jgi:tRNA-dihydrouridine synthase B
MQNEKLALEIVSAVVEAAAHQSVPVTLKMRTGWSEGHKNAVAIARDAESAGVQMLTVHGRTREQGYKGLAEYDTIAAVKAAVRVPVVANGDITSPEKAKAVLAATQADAIMIGRAAQGRPWIFREIVHFLATGAVATAPKFAEIKRWLLDHLHEHYGLYGEQTGLYTARKHIAWYVQGMSGGIAFRNHMNTLISCEQQLHAVALFFDNQEYEMPKHHE